MISTSRDVFFHVAVFMMRDPNGFFTPCSLDGNHERKVLGVWPHTWSVQRPFVVVRKQPLRSLSCLGRFCAMVDIEFVKLGVFRCDV